MRMRLMTWCGIAGLGVLVASAHPSNADMRMWVGIEDLKRHTCPSDTCGIVGRFFFQESVRVFETADGWSRVSNYKSAACFDGTSIYVESGPSDCSTGNGISQGRFAEWVKSQYLVSEHPREPLQGDEAASREG